MWHRVLTRPVFLASAVVTCVSVVVIPGQYVPVLHRYDLRMISASFGPLAVGTLLAVGGAARRHARASRSELVIAPVVASFVITTAAVAYYLAVGGIGRPGPGALAGVTGVTLAALCGVWLSGRSRALGRVLTTVVAIMLLAASVPWLGNAAPAETGGAVRCRVLAGIRYCAYPGFEGFIPHWRRTVESVLARVPNDVRAQAGLVRQRFDERPSPGAVATPKSDWGRGAGKGTAELALGLDAANWAVGIPRTGCYLARQARAAVALWLAAEVSDDASHTMRGLPPFADAIVGSTFADPAVSVPATAWATAMLDRPREELSAAIRQHWATLTDPATTFDDAGRLLGLTGVREVREHPGEVEDRRAHPEDSVPCR